MWHLVDMDDGIIDTADTKRKLLKRNGFEHAHISHHRLNKPVYQVYKDASDGIGGDLAVYSSKEQLISDGFGWIFEEPAGEGV